MNAIIKDIENLKKIQTLSQEVADQLRIFEKMPEKAEYITLSKKQKEIEEKLAQVHDMQKDTASRYERLLIEDSNLHEREVSVQHSIDEAAGDFRNLEVRTKELDGIASRRSLLADMILKVDEEKDKILALVRTLEDAADKIQIKKDALDAAIVSKKKEAEGFLQKHNKELDELYKSLPAELSELYRKSSSKVGSVVLSEIEGDKCKVCRSTLEPGTLLDLTRNGNIGVCPSCERVLIIQTNENAQ